MSENNLYYIYIDSKIEGTIDQLLSYFQTNVFDKDDCICIYFKFYKEIEKYIHKKFSSTGIRFQFIRKNSDFIFEPRKVVFYLFNAQSNCRVVARRDLTHIFVTHGESHKLASIKPIIRIYDFVVSSGQVGVERFLKAGIFNLENIHQESRLITMGNTFIGQSQYRYDQDSKVLLYAPTWEGGVPSENYSSISEQAAQILIDTLNKNALCHLFIQIHPNLGHRDKQYKKQLIQLIRQIRSNGFGVTVVKSTVTLYDRWLFKNCHLICLSDMAIQQVKAAVVDISAMEMQCISEHIPTIVLYKRKQLTELIIPKRIQYLYLDTQAFDHPDYKIFDSELRSQHVMQHLDYFIGYESEALKTMSLRQRVKWLCDFCVAKKSKTDQMNMGNY